MGDGLGAGDGVGDGLGEGLEEGLGEGVGLVVGCSSGSEGVGVGVGESVIVNRSCVFSFETVSVCVPASAVGTVTVLMKDPLLSIVAVSRYVPSHEITAVPVANHSPATVSKLPDTTSTVDVKSVLFPYNPDATALPTCVNPLLNSLKGAVAL